jgi:putative ABC transport system permease protein
MPESVIETVAHLPAVLQVEGQQYHPVILRSGPNEKRVSIEARRPGVDLSRVMSKAGAQIDTPPGGIALSSRLAAHLAVHVGDPVEVEFLQGTQDTHILRISAVIEQYVGLGAYMDLAYVNQLARQSPRISVANVSLEESELAALHAVLKDIPLLTSIIMMTDSRRSFSDTIGENMTVMNTIYIVISLLITVGVAYNGARIQLSERSRELASLRILGFTRGEVSYILIGETMLLAVLAQPLGWLIGAQIAVLMANGFSSDLYSIPLVLHASMFAKASLVVLAASLASVLIVRRRLDRQDLVAVMKTRE